MVFPLKGAAPPFPSRTSKLFFDLSRDINEYSSHFSAVEEKGPHEVGPQKFLDLAREQVHPVDNFMFMSGFYLRIISQIGNVSGCLIASDSLGLFVK
jgi:hypothetical protein